MARMKPVVARASSMRARAQRLSIRARRPSVCDPRVGNSQSPASNSHRRIGGLAQLTRGIRNPRVVAVDSPLVERNPPVVEPDPPVVDRQHGNARAEYAAYLIRDLATRLTQEFGRGYSEANLRNFRQFFLAFPAKESGSIRYTLCSELRSRALAGGG